MALASWLVDLATVYVLLGTVFAVPFALWGANRVDPVASGSTLGFRLIILPGAVAFWPLLLSRWLRGGAPPEERNAHRRPAERSSK